MIEPPEIVQIPVQLAAIIRIVTPREAIRTVIGLGYQELMGEVKK